MQNLQVLWSAVVAVSRFFSFHVVRWQEVLGRVHVEVVVALVVVPAFVLSESAQNAKQVRLVQPEGRHVKNSSKSQGSALGVGSNRGQSFGVGRVGFFHNDNHEDNTTLQPRGLRMSTSLIRYFLVITDLILMITT